MSNAFNELQAARNLKQAKILQDDMGGHFFEHTMYDVKDALTSILALCDMEDMKQVPRVKMYIKRVTDLLNDVRFYQNNSIFNVNHIVINVINVINAHYKSRVSISHKLATIKAYARSDKRQLERMLLYTLIEALEVSGDKKIYFDIELGQEGYDARILLKIRNFQFLPEALEEIMESYRKGDFRVQSDIINGCTEIRIRVPLFFDTKKKDGAQERT